jgi:hypothetical protein
MYCEFVDTALECRGRSDKWEDDRRSFDSGGGLDSRGGDSDSIEP